MLQGLCHMGNSVHLPRCICIFASAGAWQQVLTSEHQLQDAHGMMDDTNWSTPLTKQAFKDAVDKFPIGERLLLAKQTCTATDTMRSFPAPLPESSKAWTASLEHGRRGDRGRLDCTVQWWPTSMRPGAPGASG